MYYRETLNASEAFVKATGYKGKNAKHHAKRLLRDPRLQEMLGQQAMDDRAITAVKVADVVQGLREIAFMDPGALFEPYLDPTSGEIRGLRLKHILEMPIEVRRCIASVKVVKRNLIAGDGLTDDLYEVKFWNKNDALDKLAQYLGMLTIKVEHTVTVETLSKMSDEELAATHTQLATEWAQHVEARKRLRAAAVRAPEAQRA